MTGFRIEKLGLNQRTVDAWASLDPRFRNWPVVYTLSSSRSVYVGETRDAASRLRQHLRSEERGALNTARVLLEDRFNKSACLDLESYLIRLFAGDGQLRVLNRNEGIVDADYFDRERYRASFNAIFDELRAAGMFTRSIPEIENSDLFKLSPFKALTSDQAAAVEDIVDGLFADIESGVGSQAVVQGDPGTGKTVVAIYLMKLLNDIKACEEPASADGDTMFSDFFQSGHAELLHDYRFALVVPQQSLRRSIQRVFRKTPGLTPDQVLSPFQVGKSEQRFDLLIVDEAHRLGQRAAQPSAVLNRDFAAINERLFGRDDVHWTQLDWIEKQSTHQVLLIDGLQSVKPADIPSRMVSETLTKARSSGRHYRLLAQHRVRAGADYVGYIRSVLGESPPPRQEFDGYDLRTFDDLGEMRQELLALEQRDGLSRLLAGYAWPWRSKTNPDLYDIVLDGEKLRWNSTAVDWVGSPDSHTEVGSIHTIQGYDLNYAGVIIGNDLRWDPSAGRVVFDRSNYHDVSGKKNNTKLGIVYSDDDLLQYVRNIYAVLLTRGIKGTFVYVCDPGLRTHLARFL